jgi:uncharacterized protein (DUF433 family)
MKRMDRDGAYEGPALEVIEETLSEDEFLALMKREPVIDWRRSIDVDPNIAFGKPVVRGTRLAAEFILDLYASGWTDQDVLTNYPDLTNEDLRAVFAFAADCVAAKQLPPARDRIPG